jgi:2-polyprenyl-6-hydroxyphenyl methylase/3-demethylubiquinone-9 3-methyltransferase
MFFFHTFNRNLLAWLVVVKGVEWFVRNTPPDMHLLRLFIKPNELRAMCVASGLRVAELHGSVPVVRSKVFFRMLATGIVSPDFRFEPTSSTLLAYTGFAERR